MKMKLLCFLSATFAVVAHGAEFTKSSDCVPGQRVSDRTGKTGVIKEISNELCVVRYQDGTVRSSLHWMLSPEGNGTAAGSDTGSGKRGLAPGSYVCSATGAGTFPIIIVNASQYKDRAGKTGDFALQDNKQIVFRSGSLAGQYSELLKPGKFGLSSAKGKMFYTVCNLK